MWVGVDVWVNGWVGVHACVRICQQTLASQIQSSLALAECSGTPWVLMVILFVYMFDCCASSVIVCVYGPYRVTLEDLYNGKKHEIEYPRKILCPRCNG